MLTCLLILAITLFLLTLYSILQTNAETFPLGKSRFFSIKILDTASAASLFFSLLGAIPVRHQFPLGVLPRINYKSTRTERRNNQNPDGSYQTWRVEILNTGLGSAIITRCEYILECAGAKSGSVSYTFEDLVKELAKINLVRERDYWLEHTTNGFSLSPKENCFLFEIQIVHIEKLELLEFVLCFHGQLGDRYRREIILLPRL